MASNHSSATGNHNEGMQNVNVKKSINKLGGLPLTDIRDRDMDISPENNRSEINFQNHNQGWMNQKY